ncbi:MAG: class I SAM-dependent methyltransferase [Neptuniibacter sp.]
MLSHSLAGRVAVRCFSPELESQAESLAQELELELLATETPVSVDASYDLILEFTEPGLQIHPCGKGAPGPTKVDFLKGAVAHRRQFGGGKGQMIAKAVGVKGSIKPTVLDATAGLGKDAFVLATLGCQVTMLERSPIIHALLQDGLHRAQSDPDVSMIIDNMALYHANSIEWMQQHSKEQRFQVVYLDPMFPHSDKSALVKKEMRTFRPIVGDDLDAAQLLDSAMQIAENRVVVKRPRKAPFLADKKPSLQFEGKSSRYDVYPLKKLEA